MPLTAQGKLSIAVIIFFAPTLIPTILLYIRHGLRRPIGWVGWIYLLLVPTFRIVGPSLQLAADATTGPNRGMRTAATVFAATGLVPLIFAVHSVLERIISRISSHHTVHARLLWWFNILALVSFILATIASTQLFSSNPNTVSTGRRLNQVSSVLLCVALAFIMALSVFCFTQKRQVAEGDVPLLHASVSSIPFLALRMAYSLGRAFKSKTPFFNLGEPNPYGAAFLQYLPELIVVVLLIVAGFKASVVQRKPKAESLSSQENARLDPLLPTSHER